MAARDDFRLALETGNVRLLRKFWAAKFPHLPQPKDAAEAEIQLHMARTATESIALKLRAYSHRWLTERSLPSQLPDHLKPSAEQICPRVAEAVGISVNFGSSLMKPAVPLIRGVMEDAVNDCFANGDKDPVLVKSRMMEARADEAKRLFGRFPSK